MKDMMDNKHINTNIGVGSVVNTKVREIEENTREVRIRSIGKYVVGCVQAVVGENRFLVKFEDVQKRDMSACLLLYLCKKEEFFQVVDETFFLSFIYFGPVTVTR